MPIEVSFGLAEIKKQFILDIAAEADPANQEMAENGKMKHYVFFQVCLNEKIYRSDSMKLRSNMEVKFKVMTEETFFIKC